MANPFFPLLFSPWQVRGRTIKNRIVSAPQSCPYMFTPGDNGCFDYSDDAVFYYGNIARGGAAVVNTGHLGVDPRYYLGYNKVYFNFFTPMRRWHQIPNMRRMSTLIHAYGALASIELNHGGHFATPIDSQSVPGPCDCTLVTGKKVRGIDEEEMNEIADYFAHAAEFAVDAGFDMINIHGGHNWLLGQFFSPIENQRADKYGGSVENRARFPKLVLQRVRQKVGPEVIIKMRFSATESCEGGYGIDEGIQTIQFLQDSLDIVQCSVGKFGFINSSGVLAGGGVSPVSVSPMRAEAYTFSTQYMANGCNSYLAEKMKENVDILVETVGGINTPDVAEQILAEGKADLIGMARSFIADPNWARKAELGHAEDIRPCLRCMRCMETNTFNCVGECTVNPRRVLYKEFPSELPFMKKNVAVVGGGPAGLMAAIELGNKGHKVTLYESSGKLGGRLAFADHIEFKCGVMRYRDYLVAQVRKNENVQIKLNTTATPELLRSAAYDAVVVAMGAKAISPVIPGMDLPQVIEVEQIFGKEDQLGQRVAIIGGGQVGCETAIHLSALGKTVYIVEARDEMMKDADILTIETFATRFYLEHKYSLDNKSFLDVPKDPNIHQLLNHTCREITPAGVVVEEQDKKKLLEVESVVLAAGYQPDEKMREQLADTALEVLFIGDCNGGKDLHDTAEAGYHAALRI